MHKNVPPKFNQICRLCLTLVSESANPECDEIVRQLSIFNDTANSSQHGKSQSNDDDEQLKKKVKRSNDISVSLSGSGVVNNGFSSSTDDIDDADFDMTKRISQCLSIKVSHISSIFFSSYFSYFSSTLCSLLPFSQKSETWRFSMYNIIIVCEMPSPTARNGCVPIHVMIEFYAWTKDVVVSFMFSFFSCISDILETKRKETIEWIFQV